VPLPGKTLYDLGKAGLARKPDENQKLWLITDKGRKYIENPPVLSDRPLEPTLEPTTQTDHQNLGAVTDTGRDYLKEQKQLTGTTQKPPPGGETVPPQADLFKAEGKREIEARSKETLKQRSYYSAAGAGDTTTAINTISNTRRSNVATELSLLLAMLSPCQG